MFRKEITHFSDALQKEMHVIIYGNGAGDGNGQGALPFIGFPTQNSMCRNYEDFGMIDVLRPYLESGRIQLFCVDTVDQDSWSCEDGINAWRTARQESYYHYIVDEVLPLVRECNHSGRMPFLTGFSMGATHSAIMMFRRPDLFGGMIALSGVYDTAYFFGGYMDSTLYQNAPMIFLRNMPSDHPYIPMYNERNIIFCVGQGAWEDEGVRTLRILEQIFREKGIRALCDFWGYDVNHDWPWWFKQMPYFLDRVLGES